MDGRETESEPIKCASNAERGLISNVQLPSVNKIEIFCPKHSYSV